MSTHDIESDFKMCCPLQHVDMCRVHKPGVPHGPASQQRLGLAEQRCEQRAAHGPAQTPKRWARRAIQSPTGRPGRGGTASASDSGPPLRLESSLQSPARLRTASPTGRPGQSTTSDSEPRLRPGMRQNHAHCSSPTSAIRADWDQPIGDTRSVRTRKWTEKVRQGAQVKTQYRRPYPVHLQKTVLSDLPGTTEPKQCYRRQHFPL